MNTALIFVAGILCGAFSYRAYMVLTGASLNIRMFRMAELYCLRMLVMCVEDAIFIKESKHKVMKGLHVFSDEQREHMRKDDEYNLKRWQDAAIKMLIQIYPPLYRHLIQYDDWDSAMVWLNANMKKILDKSSG